MTPAPESVAIGLSLALLGGGLLLLTARSLRRFLASRETPQAMWAAGMGMASVAMGIEVSVYWGYVSGPLLEAYVFTSAALVGLLSLGSLRVLRNAWIARGYGGFILGASAVLAWATATTPLPPSMVTDGIIVGAPPANLLLLSSIVTAPATIVLLATSVISLRASHRWQSLLIVAGALVLGAGGTFYIASFPVALYYAEFIGIVMLFAGVIALPSPRPVADPRRLRAPA